MEPPPWRATAAKTQVQDLPDVIMTNIFAAVSDTRSRNALALVCKKWLYMERTTRSALSLRGNARNLLFMIPSCFRSITHLDLSLLSPWGHDFILLSSAAAAGCSDPLLLAHVLRQAFPGVTSLTLYSRTPATLEVIAPLWPRLSAVKLVRWHQRPSSPVGADFLPLLEGCPALTSLDLSDFYHWTEDLPAALEACPLAAAGLTKLDLMIRSFQEGFKTNELRVITSRCPNLAELRVACTFNPRLIDFVGDDALQLIASNCPKLLLLHLADASTLTNLRGHPDDDGSTAGEAGFGLPSLIDLFSALPLLEDLRLDVCRNVRDSRVALEALSTKCPRLSVLKLGQFQTICLAIGSELDGIALCSGLRSVSVKNCSDLTDMGLIAIARGCSILAELEVEGCREITERGIRTVASLLNKTLVDVRISCCRKLDAAAALQAVEPIMDRIQRLHIDCVWNGLEAPPPAPEDAALFGFDLNEVDESCSWSQDEEDTRAKKKCKFEPDTETLRPQSNGGKTWNQLRRLSLWVAVGEVLTPLRVAGLEDCPRLEEICIKVEGNCRDRARPVESAFGLRCLAGYPSLRKLEVDCGGVEGNALTAPSGQMDLSLWERFYLNGVDALGVEMLDYWVPQDSDLNQRVLSLPAAGLLAQCGSLRRLFIHGTAHEHFMSFLLNIGSLREAQLRLDYYPAPDNDMSTEMRVDSCSRFEDALNMRSVVD